MNKKQLYESILRNVSLEVKKALDVNFNDADSCKLQELFDEYDDDCLVIEDFDLKYKGTLITHIIKNDDGSVSFWAGDPEKDKYAEEILLPKHIRSRFINEIYEYL
ncbi:MAG: hypothetical protein [Wendovervirus sonii]|uniref:Uncharacterized protein n=1 Tax=phage Lak_Megaphage_Sonny TaxID=3109229 RepID=A0ABZ0Z741_9CAUD|nr:MAG: hypothetical protein [phage Lak_Megaphage_Sonny]